MELKYNINQEAHKIIFCSKNKKDFIVSDLKKLSSDKKVFFIYDKNNLLLFIILMEVF